jgi:predicted nucleic acid-binding protein
VTAAGDALLDTGPLVALLNARDDDHGRCATVFREFRGRLLTTEPILTEAMYLLAPIRGGNGACIDFFARKGAVLVPQSSTSLLRAKDLLAKYDDVPMDFADATLVALADEVNVGKVFTLDRRGFGVYRFRRNRSFSIVPH